METLHLYEIPITLFFQNLGDWLVGPLKGFTMLGVEEFYLLVMPALFWCIDFQLGIRIGAMLLLSNGFNATFKLAFHSSRPYWFDPQVKAYITETSFGLPSGHAQNAASLWGLLAASIKDKFWRIVIVIIIFLIGFSRIFLGVHFTSDVLLGWTIGGLLLLAFLKLEPRVKKWLRTSKTKQLFLWAFLSTAALMILPFLVWISLQNWELPNLWITNSQIAAPGSEINPLNPNGIFTLGGICFGMAIGLILLIKRFGGFDVSGTILQRVLRYFVGIIGIVILWYGLGSIFPRTENFLGYSLRFLRYSLIGLWVSILGPYVFMKLGLANQVK